MAENERGAMFDEFIEGGLLDDADVVIRSARFNTWDYKGKIRDAILALRADMVDADGKVHEQQMSAGELKFFVPSSDGRKAVPVGQYQKLNKNTNAAAFIMSIINCDVKGEMAAKIRATDDISILDGLRVHVIRKKQPKRPNLVAPGSEAASAQEDEKSQLTVDRILAYPWEAGGGAVQGTTATPVQQAAAPQAAPVQASAPTPAAGAGAVNELAAGVVMAIIGANGGSIKKAMIAGKVYTHDMVKAEPPATKNAILGLVTRDDFLLSLKGSGVKFDPQTGDVAFG